MTPDPSVVTPDPPVTTPTNHAPTASLTLITSSVPESAATGTAIAAMTTADVDGDHLTITLSGADAGKLAVVGNEIRLAVPLDYESGTHGLFFTVTVSDGSLSASVAASVAVTDVNEAPTLTATSAPLLETAAAGTVVATLAFSDPEGQSPAYTITGPDAGLVEVSGNHLVLKAGASLDAAANPSIDVTITASDGTNTVSRTVSAAVTDVNEAPTDITLSAATIAENTTGTVGGLTVTDPDVGDSHTLSIVGGSDAGHFTISGTNLLVSTPFDAETQSTAQVTVRATDADGQTYDKTFTVAIADVNEAPTSINLSASSIDDGATGTVGAISVVDPDAGDTHTLSIVGGADAANFTISGANLMVATPFDASHQSTAQVTVRATDSDGLTRDQTFTISVGTVNRTPTDVSLSACDIDENATGTVGTLSATDADGGDTHTFSIVGGADAGHFSITGNSLVVSSPFDAETQSTATLVVRATDAGGLFHDKTLTVTVTNVNEQPTGIALSAATVAENATGVIGTLSTTDPDAGDTVTYSIVGGADSGHFSITGSTLNVVTPFDYESQTTASVTVRATDAGGLTYDKAFTVAIGNVNEAPSAPVLSAATVAENAINATVGTLSSSDPDAGDSVTYSIVGGADAGAFQVVGSTLKTNGTLNYETGATRSVTIRATDSHGLTADSALTITVTDENDAPTAIALSSNTIAENATGVVVTLSTTDEDAGDVFTYSIIGGADAANFSIFSNSLAVATPFNYEAQTSATVVVRSMDSQGQLVDRTLTVLVTNVDEAPGTPSATAATIAENATGAVSTLSATDPEGGAVTYSIVGGADAGHFSISGNSLVVASPFDYEAQTSATVLVEARDAAGHASGTRMVTVAVTNVNEAPGNASWSSGGSIAENSANGSVVGQVAAADPEGAAISYSLTNNAGGRFSVNAGTGQITVANGTLLDYEASTSHTIVVRASDGTTYTDTTLSVTVSNVDEAPSTPTLTGATAITENVAGLTVVGTAAASDPEGAAITWSLSNDDGGRFSINAATGQIRYVGAGENYESATSRSIGVTATDATGHATTATLSVAVSNVAEGSISSAGAYTSGLDSIVRSPFTLDTSLVSAADQAGFNVTASVTLDTAAKGVLAATGGTWNAATGTWSYAGSLAGLATALASLTYDPRQNAFGSTETTTLTLSVTGTYATSATTTADSFGTTGTGAADNATLPYNVSTGSVDLGAGTDSLTFAPGTNALTSVIGVEGINLTASDDNLTIGSFNSSCTVSLGGGNDTLTVGTLGGTLQVNGGTGTDTLNLTAAATGANAVQTTAVEYVYATGSANQTVYIQDAPSVTMTLDLGAGTSDRVELVTGLTTAHLTLSNTEQLYSYRTTGGLSVYLDNAQNGLAATAAGYSSTNYLYLAAAGNGANTLAGVGRWSMIYGDQSGDDNLTIQAMSYTTASQVPTIALGGGNDTLNLTLAADLYVGISGGAGNDSITLNGAPSMTAGSTSGITAAGGLGTDTLAFTGATASTVEVTASGFEALSSTAGTGTRLVTLTDTGSLALDVNLAGTNDRVTLSSGLSSLTLTQHSSLERIGIASNSVDLTLTLVDNVATGNGGMIVSLNQLTPTGSGDTLVLAAGANTFNTIYHCERILGTATADSLTVTQEAAYGYSQDIDLGDGDDVAAINIHGQTSSVYGTPVVHMGLGNDVLTVTEARGNSHVYLGDGNDVLDFTRHVETATSYTYATGGLGNDTYKLGVSNVGPGDWLRITDFAHGEDRLDLSKVVGTGGTLTTSLVQAVDDGSGHAAIQARANTSSAWDTVAVLDNVSVASAVISTWLSDNTIHS